ncbi:hypothetical protein JVU11DRAFT_6960 [Chiua virens]|nr:hypothetical protein JVU11DRAFT_6960 [Chiua virens]
MSSTLSEYDPNSNKPLQRPKEDPTHLPPDALTAHGFVDYSPETAATVCGPRTHPPLDALFYAPSLPPSLLSPRTFPGIEEASTKALIKTLSDNHARWHIFFNYKGFHNHAAHHLLAIWALGAPGPVIEAAYATHCEYQRPAFDSPEHINNHNFYKHLGDERYYASYLDYFTSELLQKNLNTCLEEYVFAPAANFGDMRPEMLSRFMGGVLHPLIHTGYGAEFNSVGVSAEGLAMAAVQGSNPDLIPRVWFPDVVSSGNAKDCNRTALSILALVSCDPRFSRIQHTDEEKMYLKVLTDYGSIIHNYVNMWKFDISTEGIADAIEELSWANVVIYGVGGFVPDEPLNADFFLMHLVTSSIFLPSLLAYVDKFSSRRLLLMTYFTASLSIYVARGRPQLDIRSFFKNTESLLHKVPGPTTEPAWNTLPNPTSDLVHTPNAWYPMIQTTIVHPNEHLCKTQRALAHHSSLYGNRERGWCAQPRGRTGVTTAQVVREKEAEDKVCLQELDGTLFVRVARLTQNKLGWMREGEMAGDWDNKGFF